MGPSREQYCREPFMKTKMHEGYFSYTTEGSSTFLSRDYQSCILFQSHHVRTCVSACAIQKVLRCTVPKVVRALGRRTLAQLAMRTSAISPDLQGQAQQQAQMWGRSANSTYLQCFRESQGRYLHVPKADRFRFIWTGFVSGWYRRHAQAVLRPLAMPLHLCDL